MDNLTQQQKDALYKLASRCITIHGFPPQKEAVQFIADDLGELCIDMEEAEWLVKAARQSLATWGGTAALIAFLESRRNDEPVRCDHLSEKAKIESLRKSARWMRGLQAETEQKKSMNQAGAPKSDGRQANLA
jgi:hypothetical protein